MPQGSIEHLLSVLYGADGDPGDITPFLHAFGQTMRSHVLAIQTFDAGSGAIRTDSSIGVDLSWADTYAETAAENLWYSRGAQRILTHGLCDDGQMDCAHEMRRTRFHADFLRPNDIEHAMAFRLSTDPGGQMSVMTVNRSGRNGGFEDGERQLANKLLPHLQNARALQARLQGLEASRQTLHATLDQLPEGIFHLAADGRVMLANETALMLERASTLVQRKNSRLVPVCMTDGIAMYKALQVLLKGANGALCNLRLHGRDGKLGGLLTLCPAPPSESPWSTRRVAAIAFVRILDQPPSPVGARLQAAWELTRAECQLAQLLIQGLSLEEAADRARVSKNTVRSQVRSMYEKTGTHRQGELVALLFRAL